MLATAGIVILAGFAVLGVLTARSQAPAPASQSPATQSATVPQWQIDAGGKMRFDVASVKLKKSAGAYHVNFPIGNGAVMLPVGGRLSINDVPLRDIIAFAYKLTIPQTHASMLGLPSWVDSERFDIEARAEGNPTKDEFRLMVQSLLADRFQLTMHSETRPRPVFEMVLSKAGKPGPQLKPHADDTMCVSPSAGSGTTTAPAGPGAAMPPLPCGGIAGFGSMPNVPGQLWMGARKVTMDLLAAELSEFDESIDRPVLDRTGLSGTFDVMVQFAPQSPDLEPRGFEPDPSAPSFLEALNKQLGLRLEPQTAPFDVMIVDRLEQPSEN